MMHPMEERLRAEAEALREALNLEVDTIDEPMCEHDAARIADLFARLDVWTAHVDKWAARQAELAAAFAQHPVMREYLEDTLTLFGVKEGDNHE